MWRDLSNTTALNRLTLRRQSEVTTYRAKHLTSISTIAYHSHFYSHPSSLLTMSEWLGEELVYDRSRFLERHEAPLLSREAKACRAWRMSFMRHMKPVSRKKSCNQASAQDENKTKATPTTTHHQEENFGAQCHPNPCHLQRLQHPLHQRHLLHQRQCL